jgi:outer membrane biosynthesis protein TonB
MRQIRAARGFVGGVAVLCAIVMLALLAWKTSIQVKHIPPNTIGADRYTSKYISSAVGVGVTFIALAGGVGAASYFAFRRSERAAAVGMNIVLGLGIAVFSFQLYRYYAHGPQSVTSPGPVASQSQPSVSQPNPPPVQNRPVRPPQVVPQPAPSNSTQPAPTPARNPSPTPVPTPATVQPDVPHAAIKPAVERRKAEVLAASRELAEQAAAAMDFASKPKRSGTELDAKIKEAEELLAAASALEKRLRAEDDELQKELTAAGVDTGEAMRAGVEFSRENELFERSTAAAAVGRFAEDAAGLFRVMRENLPRIQVSAAGEVSSKDREVEQKLFHVRAQVKFHVNDRDRTLGALRR